MCQRRIDVTRDDAFDIYRVMWYIYLAVCYSTRFVPIPRSGGGVDRWPTNELGQVESNAQRVRVLPE